MSRGFTLLELLVVTCVVALLAALSLPGFQQVIQRANRQEARLALLRVQHRQERHFAQHLRYAAELGGTGVANELGLSVRSDAGLYQLELQTGADGMSYTVIARATPGGRQSGDSACAQFSIDQTGQRRSADIAGAWRNDDAARCWS